LRVYIERYVNQDGALDLETEDALKELIADAHAISEIRVLTGRTAPDVIT